MWQKIKNALLILADLVFNTDAWLEAEEEDGYHYK